MGKQEDRLEARTVCEEAIHNYYEACKAADYGFKDDICDIIWDTTDNQIELEPD